MPVVARPQDSDMAPKPNPDHAAVHLVRGDALRSMGRHAEAVGCFAKVIRLDPRNTDAHYGMGRSLRSMGRHAEAVGYFDRMVDLIPTTCAPILARARY